MNSNDLIVDVQGFKTSGNKFVFKELAILQLLNDNLTSYLFKPPFPWSELEARYKSENNWLSRNYHGLDWESGDVPFGLMQYLLLFPASTIYVKGMEKRVWLKKEFPTLCFANLEDFGCPSLQKLKNEVAIPVCSYHSPSTFSPPNCAIQNVRLLKHWFSNHIM